MTKDANDYRQQFLKSIEPFEKAKKLEEENRLLKQEIENLKQYKKILMENSVVRSDYIKELEKELIEAYRSRGNMYWAGEREWIQNRIKDLEGECE